MSTLVRIALILGLALLGATASAHTRSESYSVWEINGHSVSASFTLPDVEAARLGEGGVPSDARVASYLAEHVSATAGEHACTVSKAPRAIAASKGFRRFELAFNCESNEGNKEADITLHSSAFFDLVPSHVTYARIRNGDAGFVEQLISNDHRDIAIGGEGSASTLQNASFFQYIWQGVLHILTGPDHIAFLLGLVLISRKLRDLAFVITGFTLGHSATLALAVTGVFRPHAEFIDVLIALTIGLIGAENIIAASGKPRIVAIAAFGSLLLLAVLKFAGFGLLPAPLLIGAAIFAASYLLLSNQVQDAAWIRLVVTLVFGLIHGFAFATDLIEMKLPSGRLAELLVGFNLGVESGQLIIVALMLGLTTLLVRARLALPRALVTDVLSSALVGLGTFWIITRVYA
ncbi:HupE/UreJ family protein [Uliginosibacterium sp. H3]|uniref:HupE/UreJ family protein n=1 Tax=Uliginosibacterium silvisoli TaxID=3114758 RepID=A0ABU6K2W5_9RHOO|nr:HupE/UreJ family protein [Uliginosibacterium sp. H3]